METKIGNKESTNIKNNSESKRTKSVERILISSKVSARVDGWITQLEKETKAIRISRSDVTNFLLLAHSDQLSPEEISELGKLHFDEVKFSFWLARTLKNAKSRGENVSLEQLYKEYART